ncbi:MULTISPECIES: hypothetical protein [unclassified Bartonella]|uniref:hypothetical protein n=1 Tax=unclassified Bartonella TaxID=2645622 RepID=UPI0035CEA97B
MIRVNLEDPLAENFYNIMIGQNISFCFVHEVDAPRIFYLLHCCPKHILDGCYLKYALENYLARERTYMYWKVISYYLSQSIGTTLPSIEFMLTDDFQKISAYNAFELNFYEKLEFSTEPYSTMEKIIKWLESLFKRKEAIA